MCELYATTSRQITQSVMKMRIHRLLIHTARHKLLNKRKYANVSISRGPLDLGCSSLNGIIRHAEGSAAICNSTTHATLRVADANKAPKVRASANHNQRRKGVSWRAPPAQVADRLVKVAIFNSSRCCLKICSKEAEDLVGQRNCRIILIITKIRSRRRGQR